MQRLQGKITALEA